jgi:hypothetical protein
MRTILALASVALLVGAGFGCGDDTTTGAADMTAIADMSATPHDMTTLNCSQVLDCASKATTATAQAACFSEANSKAQGLLTTALGCAYGACGSVDAGGTGMCKMLGDMTQGCLACVSDIVNQGVVNQGACATQVQACANDT